jgi:hypothetical protein
MRTFTTDFVVDLIKVMLTSPKALRVIREHVKFQYLYTEAQKKIFKYIFDFYDTTTKYPSIGMIGQAYSSDQEVISTLSVVKKLVIDNEQLEGIMSTLESFIIDSRFRLLYDRLGDLYNEGKKDEAIKLLAKESKEIQEFRIKDNYYSTVFSGFEERQSKRQIETDSVLLEKCTWGRDWRDGCQVYRSSRQVFEDAGAVDRRVQDRLLVGCYTLRRYCDC